VTRTQAWARAGAVFAAVLVADQLTKALVRGGLAVGEEHKVLPGVHFVRVRNEGIAFGLLGDSPTWLVVIVVVAALGGLLLFFARNVDRPYAWLATGLLLGGAAGNIIDRVADGAVNDWIKLPHWPAFNLADISITLGVVALVFAIDAPRGR
jgi:signal peptidase II